MPSQAFLGQGSYLCNSSNLSHYSDNTRSFTHCATGQLFSISYNREFLCGAAERNLTSIHEGVGWIPGLAQWVKDPVCCELWCRLQTWLGYRVAVAVAVV